MRRRSASLALALTLAAAAGGPGALAQQGQQAQDAQQRLQGVRSELRAVAAERRRLEGQRGTASRQLRAADETVGATQKALERTRNDLAQSDRRLLELQAERARHSGDLESRRAELLRLLRAAQAGADAAPLKALLARDRVQGAERALILQGYLQRAQVARIRVLAEDIARLQTLEAQIAGQRTALEQARQAQATQMAQAQAARKGRADLLAGIDRQYRDRASRERALGQDAKALQTLLAQLRAAAAKAAREQARAREREREQARLRADTGAAATHTPPRVQVATAPAPRVGGLSWPVSGNLLAGFGGRMPDGRRSDGVLIAAAAGTRVQAVADGTVVYADWMTGYGMILIIDHGNGYMSLYAHNDGLLREAGDVVRKGDAVATVGSSGGQAMPALYFELRQAGKPVNPSVWLTRQ
ncbi:peptidoglycan DD-metalloendopeptidase family protein [Thermomonas sp.]|uniref:murein hydrolase activator EnvC family protein n=2 Tax=Thermomonas sp. TaxID=1971895 RepID=UPI002606F6F2|nr:peptidoglycan DD-metalloendopeptidase family protein [Thermomonas sp.]MCO5055799.1 peptidoglycan DD-metalloendopeptidase family protein [Thermomonas sp.]